MGDLYADSGVSAFAITRVNIGDGNLSLRLGDDGPSNTYFLVTAKRTVRNRIKWWLACRLLPFTVETWRDIK